MKENIKDDQDALLLLLLLRLLYILLAIGEMIKQERRSNPVFDQILDSKFFEVLDKIQCSTVPKYQQAAAVTRQIYDDYLRNFLH